MSKITTEDCKSFLKETLSLPDNIKLKRLKKYKDEDALYLRDFSDENGNVYCVKEQTNGKLTLHDNVSSPSLKTQKPTEFNAKKFIKKIIKDLEKERDDGDFEDEEVVEKYTKQIKDFSLEDKKKLASQFTFFFPDDTYHNDINSVVQDINTLMINDHHSFCINFYDKTESEPDLYLTDILRAILPEYFEKVDEYHFEIDAYTENKNINSMTIKDTIDLLEDLGFSYQPKSIYDEVCMLSVMNIDPHQHKNVNTKKHKM